MNWSAPTLQAGALAWGALGVVNEVFHAPVALTIMFAVLAILSQCMAFGAAHTK